jgi:DnaJ-domain-containing protein 1
MKACHPDLFSNASDTEKQQAHQQAQKVNSAFQFLKKHFQNHS